MIPSSKLTKPLQVHRSCSSLLINGMRKMFWLHKESDHFILLLTEICTISEEGLGLCNKSHPIVMHIPPANPVPRPAANHHHPLASPESQFTDKLDDIAFELRLCCETRSIWKQVMAIHHQPRDQLHRRDVHDNRTQPIAQPQGEWLFSAYHSTETFTAHLSVTLCTHFGSGIRQW